MLFRSYSTSYRCEVVGYASGVGYWQIFADLGGRRLPKFTELSVPNGQAVPGVAYALSPEEYIEIQPNDNGDVGYPVKLPLAADSLGHTVGVTNTNAAEDVVVSVNGADVIGSATLTGGGAYVWASTATVPAGATATFVAVASGRWRCSV